MDGVILLVDDELGALAIVLEGAAVVLGVAAVVLGIVLVDDEDVTTGVAVVEDAVAVDAVDDDDADVLSVAVDTVVDDDVDALSVAVDPVVDDELGSDDRVVDEVSSIHAERYLVNFRQAVVERFVVA